MIAPPVTTQAAPLSMLPTGQEPPDWLLIAPAGVITGRDGRITANRNPSAVVAAFEADRVDIPVDVEHSTHVRAPQGLDAPAVGWIESMRVQAGAIWGRVRWTLAGREAIINRAYRYFSPAYMLTATRDLVGIASVGLTNKPNLLLPALNRNAAPAPLTEEQARIAAAFGNSAADLALSAAREAAECHRRAALATDPAARIRAAFFGTRL